MTEHPLTTEVVQAVLASTKRIRKAVSFERFNVIPPAVAGQLATSKLPQLCLDGLTELSDEVARALSDFKGELSLNGLKDISLYAIEQLSDGPRCLRLGGLPFVSESQAAALSAFPGKLTLLGLQSISDTPSHLRLVEHLCETEGLETQSLRNIPLTVLAILAQKIEYLRLYLSPITLEQATILADHVGSLSINGMRTLTPEVARLLAQHQGELQLDGDSEEAGWFESLPLDVYAELSNFRYHLRLQVRSISDEAAQLLADNYCGTIDFESLTKVSDKALVHLARLTGRPDHGFCDENQEVPLTCLPVPALGLESWEDTPGHLAFMHERLKRYSNADIASASGLAEEAVAALVPRRFDLRVIQRPEIHATHISPAIAQLLGNHAGGIIIEELNELSLEVARSLFGGRGEVFAFVPAIDAATAEYLADEGKGFIVVGLKELPDTQGHLRLLRQYLEDEDSFKALGVATLSASIAREIVRYSQPERTLVLEWLEALDEDCATALSSWEGTIVFDTPLLSLGAMKQLRRFRASYMSFEYHELSAEMAAELCKFRGELSLKVHELSEEVAGLLAQHRNALELPALRRLSPVAAELLSKHRPKVRPTSILQYQPELYLSRLFS